MTKNKPNFLVIFIISLIASLALLTVLAFPTLHKARVIKNVNEDPVAEPYIIKIGPIFELEYRDKTNSLQILPNLDDYGEGLAPSENLYLIEPEVVRDPSGKMGSRPKISLQHWVYINFLPSIILSVALLFILYLMRRSEKEAE
ncbi:MAG: hypothetical protein KC618_06215 [Candidatus Omnitrophica bacterium]|nr:hypothetical protein [Candidatus Omnitrophota bacterium]